MRRVLVVLALIVLVACGNDTHNARCNQLLAAPIRNVNDLGGIVLCDPSHDSDEPANAQFVVQWNRPEPIVWLWEDRQDDWWLKVHAYMGVYEIVAWRDGRVQGYDAGVPRQIEQEALSWAVGQVGSR